MVMKLITDRDETCALSAPPMLRIVESHSCDYRKLHDEIAASKEFGRGVFLVGFRTDDRTDIPPRFAQTLFCDSEQFPIAYCSNDEMVRNNAIVNLIERYDIACQYFVMFEVDEEIVGGTFVSLDRPGEFELALEQALANYRNK